MRDRHNEFACKSHRDAINRPGPLSTVLPANAPLGSSLSGAGWPVTYTPFPSGTQTLHRGCQAPLSQLRHTGFLSVGNIEFWTYRCSTMIKSRRIPGKLTVHLLL